jgi:hypothetical protein
VKDARYDSIGVKQVIRLEWLRDAARLYGDGENANNIREYLVDHLSDKRATGQIESRALKTLGIAITNIMHIWVTPDKELIPFRDHALDLLRKEKENDIPVHWAMAAAVYPFWFRTARQVGRLLSLQPFVTQKQIFDRVREEYGDREVISRCARYVVRSFVMWDVLKDTDKKGVYEGKESAIHLKPEVAALLYESVLHTKQEGKMEYQSLISNPGLFPFKSEYIGSKELTKLNPRLDVLRYNLNDETITLDKDK